MKQRVILYGAVVLLLASVFVLWGCPKKTEVTGVPGAQSEEQQGQTGSRTEKGKQEGTPDREDSQEGSQSSSTGLQPIYFDFDMAVVRTDARSTMKANGEWLKAHPGAKIRIEGNCDERGTIEYNQVLGQRRALATKRYLTDIGIAADRISIISYGKEQQVCSEHSEACWQRNRRSDFVPVN